MVCFIHIFQGSFIGTSIIHTITPLAVGQPWWKRLSVLFESTTYEMPTKKKAQWHHARISWGMLNIPAIIQLTHEISVKLK